jgi:hypothetical protein
MQLQIKVSIKRKEAHNKTSYFQQDFAILTLPCFLICESQILGKK